LNVQENIYLFLGRHLNLHGTKLLGTTLHVSTLLVSMSVMSARILHKIDKDHEPKAHEAQIAQKLNTSVQKRSCGDVAKKFFDDLASIDLKIWHVAVTLIFFYNGLTPLYPQAVQFFGRKYSKSSSEAGRTLSVIDLISAGLAPIVGFAADRFRNNIYLAEFGILFCAVGLFALNFTFIDPLHCVILMGLGFSSLSSSLWPYINTNTPSDKLGVTNGTISSVQSLVMGLMLLGSGKSLEWNGYYVTNSFLLFNLLCALCLNTVFIILHGRGMDPKDHQAYSADHSENNPAAVHMK